MSKRNIRAMSGKQLYLNQIFTKGMLFTSSEMGEGFAKVIDNYDIAPTGDAASPRNPIKALNIPNINNDYIYPVTFKQDINKQSYIIFDRTITEEDFVNDTNISPQTENIYGKTVHILKRNNNAINEGSVSFEQVEYIIKDDKPIEPPEPDEQAEEYKRSVEDTFITTTTDKSYSISGFYPVNVNTLVMKQVYFNGNDLANENIFIEPRDMYFETYLNEDTSTIYYSKYSRPSVSNAYSFLRDRTVYNIIRTENVPKDNFTSWDMSFSDASVVRVVDGDTIEINEQKYRLYGIDTMETGYKWAAYAKTILTKLLEGSTYRLTVVKSEPDRYGRLIARLELRSQETYFNTYQSNITLHKIHYVYDASEILLLAGLAVVRYTDNLPQQTIDYLVTCTCYAQDHHYKLFSEIDYDPYYLYQIPTVNYSEGNNLQITDSMYIEAVKIREEYTISAKTKTRIDFVKTIYVDYLDAIGFIGRIIDTAQDNAVIYKGLILINADTTEDGEVYHTVLLPSNKGEGVTPNIIEAVSDGYNLYNKDLLHIDNEKSESYPLSIIGATTLRLNNNELVKPYEVVSSGVIGQKILLKAIIYENGYYSYSDITSTDNYGFELILKEKTQEVNGVTINIPSIRITRNPNEMTIASSNYISIKSCLSGLTEEQLDLVKDLTWGTLSSQLNKVFEISSLVLIDNIGTRISITPALRAIGNQEYEQLITGAILEMVANVYINPLDSDKLVFDIYNNFSTINMTFGPTPSITLVNRDYQLPLDFFSEWSVATSADSTFTPLTGSTRLIYTKKANTTVLDKVDSEQAWEADIKPTDYSYIINRTGIHVFKYSIQPKLKINLNDDCPPELVGRYLENSFQEMSVIIPQFNVGIEITTISDKDLRKNVDIKNATRLDIFNGQICLYGPYTKSNILFFSKFEKYDYFPFPYGTVEIEEPITYVYNYKDSFIIFSKYNMYMLHGGVAIGDCTLSKIYENLSVHLPDIKTVNTVGNSMIFFNNGMGYIIVPNTYVDSSSNVRVYKLTEHISNFFYNPEAYIRARLPYINRRNDLTYVMDFNSYIQNNDVIIVVNILINENDLVNENRVIPHYLPVWFIYNQDYKYWRMYSTELFSSVLSCYICEPNFNNQFITKDMQSGKYLLSYFTNTYTTDYSDSFIDDLEVKYNIITMLNSGYLSVDTMNDKRFKDIIIEFDNINPLSRLKVACEFFIDSSPILLSDADVVVVDKTNNEDIETDKVLTGYKNFEVVHLGDEPSTNDMTTTEYFGKAFIINNDTETTTGRTHVRIPVYGKGRLPSFILKITSDKFYEFINYALIYKEKNINRRS